MEGVDGGGGGGGGGREGVDPSPNFVKYICVHCVSCFW